jgi:hypothetical protein
MATLLFAAGAMSAAQSPTGTRGIPIGKYEQVADALFAHQEAWSKDGRVEENRAPTDKEARFPTRNHDRQGVEVCIFKGVIRYRRQPH